MNFLSKKLSNPRFQLAISLILLLLKQLYVLLGEPYKLDYIIDKVMFKVKIGHIV